MFTKSPYLKSVPFGTLFVLKMFTKNPYLKSVTVWNAFCAENACGKPISKKTYDRLTIITKSLTVNFANIKMFAKIFICAYDFVANA